MNCLCESECRVSGTKVCPKEKDPEVCTWKYDQREEMWETDCGDAWRFSGHYTPRDNSMNFCCYCGRWLEEDKEEYEDENEEI